MVIATPSPTEVGPQLTTTMSPVADNTKNFVAFNLNYIDSPYSNGGLDVRAWNGRVLATSSSTQGELLSTANETITWTQRMRVQAGNIVYSIRSGQSTTWNTFGSTGTGAEQGNGIPLAISYTNPAASLSAYDPEYSRANSNAGWQVQRVSQMRIVQVRYYSNDVLVKTDPTVRDCLAASP